MSDPVETSKTFFFMMQLICCRFTAQYTLRSCQAQQLSETTSPRQFASNKCKLSARNRQLLFLNQQKRENGRQNVLMTKSPRKILGLNLMTFAYQADTLSSNCAIQIHDLYINTIDKVCRKLKRQWCDMYAYNGQD